MKDKPTIVCLCGSTRFMDAFFDAGWEFTLAGEIVLSVGVCKHAPHHGAEALGDVIAERLDDLHLRKIDLADRVHILNVGGYIGESTQRELAYSIARHKPVTFLEPQLGEDYMERNAHELGKLVARAGSAVAMRNDALLDHIDFLEESLRSIRDLRHGPGCIIGTRASPGGHECACPSSMARTALRGKESAP